MELTKADFKIANKEQNDFLIEEIIASKNNFKTRFSIALISEDLIACRASQSLHKVLPKNKKELITEVDQIFKAFPTFTHHGQIGSFIRI